MSFRFEVLFENIASAGGLIGDESFENTDFIKDFGADCAGMNEGCSCIECSVVSVFSVV